MVNLSSHPVVFSLVLQCCPICGRRYGATSLLTRKLVKTLSKPLNDFLSSLGYPRITLLYLLQHKNTMSRLCMDQATLSPSNRFLFLPFVQTLQFTSGIKYQSPGLYEGYDHVKRMKRIVQKEKGGSKGEEKLLSNNVNMLI